MIFLYQIAVGISVGIIVVMIIVLSAFVVCVCIKHKKRMHGELMTQEEVVCMTFQVCLCI